ncbi:hypothetical protein GCM10020295_41320 [Streptomyces cinereospinus]
MNGEGRPAKTPLPPVLDQGGLAVQQLGGAVHHPAVGDLHRLHAEADAEDGHPGGGAVPDHVDADAGLLGRAGAGRQQDAVETVVGVRGADLVVAPDLALGTQLVQVLDQVEDEAVVVVDDENARAHWLSTVTSLKGSSGSAQGNTYWNRT